MAEMTDLNNRVNKRILSQIDDNKTILGLTKKNIKFLMIMYFSFCLVLGSNKNSQNL